MSLPGASVVSRQSPPSRSAPVEAGTWFITGLAEKGPIDRPVLCRNLAQVVRYFGSRVSYGQIYDAADVFFREGGSRLYVSRVAGPSPVKSVATLSDGTNSTATVRAKNPGAWGDTMSAVITHPNSGTIKLAIVIGGVTVDSSPEVADVAALAAWSVSSDYVDVIDLGHNDPAIATTALAGGTDDHANATDATWAAAAALFTTDLGPGQFSPVGRTTANAHADALSHCRDHNRVAILDAVDTATVSTLTGAATTDRALATARYGGVFSPWAIVPGVAPGTTRTVPYSAVQAGILARNDAAGKSPNVAGAGVNGRSRYALGLSQAPWNDTDRETLNDAGVNVALVRNNAVETFGFRTLVNELLDDTWLQLTNARLYMVIAAKADAIAENYVFAEIDGKGVVFSRFNGELVGMLVPYYTAGSLYGDTAEEALFVDTGGQVNTPETIADLQINAVISLKMSPFGERVKIEIAKVATTEVI